MALASDLAALGMATPLAELEGVTIANLTATGTAQATGLALTPTQTGITLATAGGADSATLSVNQPRWTPVIIQVQTATTANIFPPVGHDINAAGANTAVTIPTTLARIFIRVAATHWISFLAA